MPSSIIPARLRSVLQAKNWTINHCSLQTGISESTLTRVLRGASVSPTTIRILADGLGCSVSDLTGEEEPAKPTTDLAAALYAQETAYERLLESERFSHQHALQLLTENCDHRISREKRRTSAWLAAAIAALVVLAAVSASYYRFHWDVTHPTMGSIQYETLDELKEALGIDAE